MRLDPHSKPYQPASLAPMELGEKAYEAAADPAYWPAWFDALARAIGHHASSVVIRGFGPTRYVDLDHPEHGFGALNPAKVFQHKGLSKRSFAMGCVSGDIVEEWSQLSPESTAVQVFTDETRRLDRRDRTILRSVLPHLHRALRLHFQMERSRRKHDALTACLDELTTGMILVDDKAAILHANQAALGYLTGHCGLVCEGGRLTAPDPDVSVAFTENLKRALSGHRRSLIAQPLDCGATLWLRGLERDRAVAYLVNEREERSLPPELLSDAFDLTPAEARVGSLFALGHSVDAIATELGISVHTVRLHVKHIQRKTGTHRQATLLRRILESIPPVYP